ncbi:MAG TPA: hypothetical protein VFV99_05390 [Kofleriaceae bacterium]|nr:hypothetical protein [Kofleriaceae bacterium]
MRTTSSLLFVALLSASSSAFAQPAVRDHRDPAPVAAAAPASAPEVRDHRDNSIEGRPRYRRRPGPRFMMPLKIDIGAAGANTSRGFAPGMSAAVGIHWASLSPRPTDTDVGIGLFGGILAAPEDTSVMNDKNGVAYGGAYLELAHTLSQGTWWRTWASGRGEYLGSTAFDQDHAGFGASGRLSAELYVSGVGIEPRGVFLGTYAIGVFVEAGVRDMVEDVGKFQMSGGLTFRTPLVFAP